VVTSRIARHADDLDGRIDRVNGRRRQRRGGEFNHRSVIVDQLMLKRRSGVDGRWQEQQREYQQWSHD
jgi:hypothetical protein